MNRVLGYTRVSTNDQNCERQKLEILEFAQRQGWLIERVMETNCSTRRGSKERGIDMLKLAAESGEANVIIFTELSRLGRSVGEICRLVDYLVDKAHLTLIFIKENLTLKPGRRDMTTKVLLSMFSLLAEIERDLISERTKSGLAARKAAGVQLGRPPGKSKLDKDEVQIKDWLQLGCTQRAIARNLGCGEVTLSKWLKRKRWKR